MKLESYHSPYTKINIKWIKHLNVRHRTMKLLEKLIEERFQDIATDNDLEQGRKSSGIKSKMKQMGLDQTKTLLYREGNNK
jgi:hypothetical protein